MKIWNLFEDVKPKDKSECIIRTYQDDVFMAYYCSTGEFQDKEGRWYDDEVHCWIYNPKIPEKN